MASALQDPAYPGLTLGTANKYLPGPGTYLSSDKSTIIASIAGATNITPVARSSRLLPTISVVRPPPALRAPLSRSVVRSSLLPTVGSTVLARVTRLEKTRVSVAILVVDDGTATSTQRSTQPSEATTSSGTVIADPLAAVIRREDIRGWEIDKVNVVDTFRVGDIVRATVISIGDQAAYYLSTARNELGVLMARSEAGNVMFPVSWKEFRDPRTGKMEGRKVAKPV